MKKLLPFLLFASCTTTEMTFPDGHTVKTRSSDPNVISALASGFTVGAATYLSSTKGFSK